jgi:delta1-piperideine-2-carboxylate reductase
MRARCEFLPCQVPSTHDGSRIALKLQGLSKLSFVFERESAMTRLTIAEARGLTERTMQAIGHSGDEARIIADHLIDCELRGLSYGGLPRALSIAERITKTSEGAKQRTAIRTESRTPVSALVHGGDNVGYLVALKAMEIAIERAKQHGIAVIGANDTWYTGMLSYYAERITAEDLVCMIASNATPWVAPFGGTQGRFGTNPICYGFPTADGDPIIWDIGTSTIMHAEVVLHGRLGTPLPEGRAYGPDGQPTREPKAALDGALVAWGGAKGSGLGLVVQLLGAMCDSPILPKGRGEYGCLFVVMSPGLLMEPETFKASVSEYAAAVRGSRPVEGGGPVRMPFERSAAERRRRIAAGIIEVPDDVHAQLQKFAAG